MVIAISLNVNCETDADAHRQRIVNWINAAGGTSSAFDVTTKVNYGNIVLCILTIDIYDALLSSC